MLLYLSGPCSYSFMQSNTNPAFGQTTNMDTNLDLQPGHGTWTQTKTFNPDTNQDIQPGHKSRHSTWTPSLDIEPGHTTWTHTGIPGIPGYQKKNTLVNACELRDHADLLVAMSNHALRTLCNTVRPYPETCLSAERFDRFQASGDICSFSTKG